MRLFQRFAHWLRLRSHQSELVDELAFHHEMVERDLVARGLSPQAARDAARRVMGNETFMREEARGIWVWPWAEALWQDAKYTIRTLRQSPGFTSAVILTLALGLGVNAAMFSVVDRILFRPPPFLVDPASAHRVYLFRTSNGTERETGGQYRRHTDLVKWTSSFSRAAAVSERELAVGVGDATRELPVAVVSASLFEFFDARPALGRYFTSTEDAPPVGAPVAVLSDAMWKRYGARRDILGATLQIGSIVYTIVGVAPAGFVGLWPDRPPVAFIPVASFGPSRGARVWWSSYDHAIGLSTIVRLKPGVSIATARADLTAAFRRSYQTQIDITPRMASMTVDQLRPRAVVASILTERGPEPSGVARVALWLSGVAVIVLIIACANVANLLLARAVRRRREIAVRVALGVSRARLLSQLLTESLLLAVAGGIAGLLMAEWASAALRTVFLPGGEKPPVIADLRTSAFAAGITICVGILAGLAPAMQIRREDLTSGLKAGAREGTYERSRVRIALLVAQGALCVVLLVGAGLFVRSLRNVRQVRLGYDVDPVLIVDMNLRGISLDSARQAALNQRLLDAATTFPGVAHGSLTKTVPFQGISSWPLFVEGIDSVDRLGEFDRNGVSPDYFATMGTRIVRGRGIEATDNARARPVMVAGASMAAALWPGKDPIGRCVRIGADTSPCTYVVGVAEDIHTHSLSDESGYYFYYLPIAQMSPDYVGLFIRTRGGSDLLEPIRRRLQQEMPGAAYVTVAPFSDVIGSETRQWSVGAAAFTGFGALALILAALGLYSVIAYGVTQRTHELGVRMALGARATDVVRLVLGEGLLFGSAGLAIGTGISLAAAHWIAPLLFKESPRDPMVFGAVSGTLILITIAASWIPAQRAASVDPKTALQAG
jgi:predicted permease